MSQIRKHLRILSKDYASVKPLIHLEQLEPRIMLSGDGLLNIAPNPQQDTSLDHTQQVVQYAELLDTNEQVEEQISLELTQPDTTNTEDCQPIFTLYVDDDNSNDESSATDLSIENIEFIQANTEIALLSYDSNVETESIVDTTEDDGMPTYINDADLSIEYATSIEIRGPPASDFVDNSTHATLENVTLQAENIVLYEYTGGVQVQSVELPELYLVDPDVNYFDGQVVYLNFDGAQDITYNGPVVVEGINIPEFSADAAGLAGREPEIISHIISELEMTFEGTGVIFTSIQPDAGTEYSTIFVGGDGSEFIEYGFFFGLAEKIDVGNQDPGDNALIFGENVLGDYADLASFVTVLTDLIDHETRHLLGYAHEAASEGNGPLQAVAAVDWGTAADAMSQGIDQLSAHFQSLFNNNQYLNAPLPVINQVEVNEAGDDAIKVAPTIRTLLWLDVDLDGDREVDLGTDEEILDVLDTGSNGQVDFLEFFEKYFINMIKDNLAVHSGPGDFTDFLNSSARDQLFTSQLPVDADVMDGIGTVALNISATNQSDANQFAFHVEFELIATKELPLDLGPAADELGLSFPDVDPTTAGNQGVEVIASVSFSVDFGVLITGETLTVGDDVFVEVDDLDISAAASVDPFIMRFDMGFLGLETFDEDDNDNGMLDTDEDENGNGLLDRSWIELDAAVTGNETTGHFFIDPTTPMPLGFTEIQFGTTATGVPFIAQNPLSSGYLAEDAQFILRIGNSDARTITVNAVGSPSDTDLNVIKNSVQAGLNAAGFGGLVTAGLDSGHLTLTLAGPSNVTKLGFTSHELSTPDGVYQLKANTEVTDFASFPDTIRFLLSLDEGVPILITADTSSVSSVDNIVAAMNLAFGTLAVTAEKNSADNTIIIKSTVNQSLGISRQLNFDSKVSLSDLTGTSTTDLVDLNVADAAATVNLSAKVASGIVGLDNDDLKITFSGNAFEQERAADAEDPKDRDRIDLDVTLSNFGDLETFTRMNASSFIGLLRQVGNWLDQARQSDLFASIDIPFTGASLGQMLDFADMMSDALIYDDGDDGVDSVDNSNAEGTNDKDKLLRFENGSLAPAFSNVQQLKGILDSLGFLESGGIAYDASGAVLTFAITLEHNLFGIEVPSDFNLELSPLLDVSSDTKIVIDGTAGFVFTFGLDLSAGSDSLLDYYTTLDSLGVEIKTDPAVTGEEAATQDYGRLSRDAVFELDIDGVKYEITITAEGTRTSHTVDDLVANINTALANARLVGTDTIVNLTATGLVSVANFIDPETEGNRLRLTAHISVDSLSLTTSTSDPTVIELGFGQSQTAQKDGPTPASLESGSDLRETVGRLSDGTVFTVTMGGGSAVDVLIRARATEVGQDDTAGSKTIIDLVNIVSRAVADAGLGDDLEVGSQGNHLVLTSKDGTTGFTVTATDTAITELGFAALQIANSDDLVIYISDGSDPYYIDLDGATNVGQVIDLITGQTGGSGSVFDDTLVPGDVIVEINGDGTALKFTDNTFQTDVAGDPIPGQVIFRIEPVNSSPVAIQMGILSMDVTGDDNNDGDVDALDGDGVIHGAPIAGDDMADRFFIDVDNTSLWGTFRVLPGQLVPGLVIDATDATMVTSEDFDFTTDHVGMFLEIKDTVGFTPGVSYEITNVDVDNNIATLSSAAGSLGSAGGVGILLTGIEAAATFGFVGVVLEGDGLLGGKVSAGLQDPGKLVTGLEIDLADSTKVTSDSFNFRQSHVGMSFKITDGAGFTIDTYEIVAVDEGNNIAILNNAAGTLGSTDGEGRLYAGQLTLNELIGLVGNIGSVVQTPSLTKLSGQSTYGKLTLGVTLEPEFLEITLGDTPRVEVVLNEIGDPFDVIEFAGAVFEAENVFTVSGNHITRFTKGHTIEVELLEDSTIVIRSARVSSSEYDGSVTRVTLVSDVLTESLSLVKASMPPSIEVVTAGLDLGDLLSFENLTLNNIVDALNKLTGLLEDLEAFDCLNESLPLIGYSVNDLLSFASRFTTAVDDFENNPAGNVQMLEAKLREVLGLPAEPGPSDPFGIELSLDKSGGMDVLRINMDLGAVFTESFDIAIPEVIDLADLDLGEGLVDLVGSAGLSASGSLTIDLDFGINLADPTQLYVYDTTGLEANITAGGEDLTFRAALGPVGLVITGGGAIIEGTFQLDIADLPGGRALIEAISTEEAENDDVDVTLYGLVDVTLPTYFPNESNYIGDILVTGDLTDPDSIAFEMDDAVSAIRDFDFDNLSLFESVLLAIDGIDLFLEGLQEILDGEVFGIELPIIGDALSGGAQFIEDFREDFIEPLREAVETTADMALDFADAQKNILSGYIYDFLGPPLLNLLKADPKVPDTDPDYKGLYSDLIGLTTNLDDYLFDPDSGLDMMDVFMQWNMTLGQTYTVGADIGFDLGIPGLGIRTEGDISVTLDWDLDLGFGISFADGFYVDVSDPNELSAYINVSFEDALLSGTLAILQLTAEINPETNFGAAFAVDIMNSADEEDGRLSFTEIGKIGLDAKIAAQALADLALTLEISGDLIGDNVAAGMPRILSGFVFDYNLGGYDSDNPENSEFVSIFDISGDVLKEGLRLVEFQDITLDLGSFVSDVIGPIGGQIQEITEPIQPIIDILTYPIPVISDLGPDLTLLDIAGYLGGVDPRLLHAIADVITLINSIPNPDTAETLLLNFGDMTIYKAVYDEFGDIISEDSFTEFDLSDPNSDPEAMLDTVMDNADKLISMAEEVFGDNWFTNTLDDMVGTAADIMDSMQSKGAGGSKFAFPIFEDPAQVFGLLMGKPAVLVTYDMPPLTFEFEYTQFFPFFGPLGISINSYFYANIDFAFGYDTLGIQEFIEGNFRNPLLLLDGFYVSDTDLATGDFGTDVPELVFRGNLYAAAELNAFFVRAGVGGGVFAEVEFDLFDPDRDGRVRIKELLGSVVNQWNYGGDLRFLAPLAIFDVSGEVTARLFAFLKINLFLFKISYEWDITPPITLVDFEIPFVRPPNLATELGNGDLQLNMGPNADQRLNGNLSDISEHFIVEKVDYNTVRVRAPGLWNHWQEYDVTGTIFAEAGEGNDRIDLWGVGNMAVKFEIEGGAGSDRIYLTNPLNITQYALGSATIKGDEGDEIIYGGGGNDIIYGQVGNDEIHAGGGNDVVFADEGRITDETIRVYVNPMSDGDDKLYGDAGDDILFGAGGDDTIYGGANNDVIIGDGGEILFVDIDVLEGEPIPKTVLNVSEVRRTEYGQSGGNDVLLGNGGNDIIYGGKGNDNIDGGAGNDKLYGEIGFDTIYGGSGGDEIYGGTQDDTIYGMRPSPPPAGVVFDSSDVGADSDDIIYGQEGKDLIHGNAGSDTIYGGPGSDELHGDDDDDFIYGQGEPDLIYGGAGNDTIDGGAGFDYIYGGSSNPGELVGDDVIYGGIGSDFFDGQGGSDTYIISLQGADNSSLINVFDTGTDPADTDFLIINGTDFADQFLLRASADLNGLAFVALLNRDGNVERLDYEGVEVLVVNSLAGDDRFAVDDVRAKATINGGIGEDFFQIGQLYKSERTPEAANVDPQDVFATIETTRGFLSNGISQPMDITGGAGDDEFIVFHNKAVLTLYGGNGDDTFTVRAFALAGSQDNLRERTDIAGGSGADLIQYAVNAPVNIDGGDGLDTVIIIGTEFADDFVITKDGVYGAGLNVNFVNIEVLRVDGAEGDDRFFVLSTDDKFMTEIAGGLGSDTFNIAGDTPPIISNDLLGHSGIVIHSVETFGTKYYDIKTDGISANVADNDEPAIVITQTDGSTVVNESGLQDWYTIVLTREPTTDVFVKVIAPIQTPEEDAFEWQALILFSLSGINEPDLSATTLRFTTINWSLPQTVFVTAPGDGRAEGVRFGAITHTVSTRQVIATGDVASALANTLTAVGTSFAGLDLAGAIVRITAGSEYALGEVRLIQSNTDNQLTLYSEWDLDSLPAGGDQFQVAIDDNFRGAVDTNVTDTFQDFRIRFPIAVGGLVGATVTVTNGLGHQESRTIAANTVNTITAESAWTIVLDDDTTYEIFRDGEPVEVNGVPLAGKITSIVTKTFVDTDVTFPATDLDGKLNGLRAATIEITGGTGVGQIRVVESSTEHSITVTTPWRVQLDATSQYVIKQYDGLALPSVTVRMDDANQPSVTITETENSTRVIEGALEPTFGASDTYEVVLTTVPDSNVEVTVIPDPDGQVKVAKVGGEPSTLPIILTFTTSNWYEPQIITVTAVDDSLREGFHHSHIFHTVSSGHGDVIDDSAVDTFDLTAEPKTSVMLRHIPLTDQPLSVQVGGELRDPGRYELSSSTIIFLDPDGRPEFVTGIVEVSYSHLVKGYNGLEVDRVGVEIGDNDAPGVLITESAESTNVIEITDRTGIITGMVQEGVDCLIFGDFGQEDFTGRTIRITAGTGSGQSRTITANTATEALVDEAWLIPPDSSSTFEVVGETAITGQIDEAGNFLFPFVMQPYFQISGVEDLDALIGKTVEITGGPGAGQTRVIDHIENYYPFISGEFIIVDGAWSIVPNTTSTYRIITEEQVFLSSDVNRGIDTVLVGSFDYDDLDGETITITAGTGEGQTNTILSRSNINGLEFLILENAWSVDTTSEYEITVTLKGVPWDDTYTVVLTKQPEVDVTIAVTPLPTRTTRAQLVTLTEQVEVDLTTLTFTTTNWNVPQTITIRAIDDWIADGGDTKVFAPRPHTVIGIQGPLFIDGMGGEGSLAGLTEPVLLPGDLFDPEDIGETNIKASTGEIIEATQTTLTVTTVDIEDYSNLIGWTVEITEGTDAAVGKFRLILGTEQQGDNTVLLLNDPWEFTPQELAALTKYAITSESHNFFVNEEERVDILTVFHEDSLADNTGYLTGYLTDSAKEGYENRIHGLGMGPDLPIGGEVQPGGITYGRIEVLVINLGLGDDEFVVDSTHKRDDFQTWTMLNTGNGNDLVTVTLDPADDGLFAVNTESGDDEVRAFESSLPLVIFGWDGADIILGGSGDDIIFGDRGRVDYLDESDRVVTRLGHSPDTITGNVSGATETTLVDETGPFPVIDDGLKGLVVWINDGPGAGQSRVIVSNTDSQLTIDPDTPWTVLPTGDSKYRITGIPSDQTDGVFRDPRRLLTVDADIGGDDTIIRGNGGQDVIIGGAAADTIDGDEGSDLIFGDNVRLDDIPGSGAAVNPRFRTLSDTTIYHDDASVQVNGQGQPGPVAAPIWADWSITLLNETLAANSFGNDYIAGGANDDTIFGQGGNDTIQGDGSIASALADNPVLAYRDADGSLVIVPSFESTSDGDDYIEGNAGDDVIFGNLGQDDIIGGSSSLFSLTGAGLRPDGSDIIFGGAGTDIYRNHPGDDTVNGHARDADMILGDNGNIFRLVDGASEYLEFSYDQSSQYEDRGELRFIPRAAQLLDYTLGGPDYDAASAASDIGAADEIHGESGDDFIYGMVGNDILFGDGQDDDLIGGYGHDWISGGTGDDGVLGDDGRIYTSRNDTNDEPLYGIEGFTNSQLNELIYTPGRIQQATINVEGQLKKTVNLTPFNVDSAATQDPSFGAQYADDIIYGGWGNDSIHGGSGDDAVSGAEALAVFYDSPSNSGNVLQYNYDTHKFEFYDADNPRTKISVDDNDFLLNFEAFTESENQAATWIDDGDDIIFGDLGNDWLVGGTGQDHLYGGDGDDLLNTDDNLDTNNDGLNNAPDYEPFVGADTAYGGAGRDVLIGNSEDDRLIDWTGEFNTYVVPFAAFGKFAISRRPMPSIIQYLYDLSENDGADQTLGLDADPSRARNGEPFGELGLIKQKDPNWHAQIGSPRDPQAGNNPGGRRK